MLAARAGSTTTTTLTTLAMQLYTSLVRLKQAMNDGRMPPMTPVSGSALAIIDPGFTIGLGALDEDAEMGLRCPVRNCGRYFHMLTHHLDVKHRGIGGAMAIKGMLQIPSTAKLVSTKYSNKQRSISLANGCGTRLGCGAGRRFGGRPQPAVSRKARRQRSADRYSMGARNLANSCDAQLTHKLIDLSHQIGRSPSVSDANVALGHAFVLAVTTAFGSWNAAKARADLKACKGGNRKRAVEKVAVLESLAAYYELRGCLPSSDQSRHPKQSPLVTSRHSILTAMGTSSWPEAMRRASSLLDIHGGRYGLPVRETQDTAAD